MDSSLKGKPRASQPFRLQCCSQRPNAEGNDTAKATPQVGAPSGNGGVHSARSTASTAKATQSAHRSHASQAAAAGVHPTDSSTLFLCLFGHDPALEHYRLLIVTATVTSTEGSFLLRY